MTAAAQTAAGSPAVPPDRGSDAAPPFGPQSPADNAARAAAEAAVLEQQTRDAREAEQAREIVQLRADLETLRNQQVEDRQVRAEAVGALRAPAAALRTAAPPAPPGGPTPPLRFAPTAILHPDWGGNKPAFQNSMTPIGAPPDT